MAPTKRYPAGTITPHGAYHILHDRIPQVGLRGYDDTTVFHMMGGLAIADPTRPERVEITDLKGLIPPWSTIDQKGATQDGVTFVDALYDPIEVEMDVRVKGRNPARCRDVARDLIASLDVKKQSELFWFTHKMGRWWAPVRWFKTPVNPAGGIKNSTQDLSLRLRADTGFWQSYPDVAEFRFVYEDVIDDFGTDEPTDWGADWTLAYSGPGEGFVYVGDGMARWSESGTAERTVVGRREDFQTTGNNQVVSMRLGSFSEWHLFDQAFNDLWGRMPDTGTPGDEGIRMRIALQTVRLSYFVGGVETVLRQRRLIIPPLPGEVWTLVCGYEDNERRFSVVRSGVTIMTVVENGEASPLGSSNRNIGAGMEASSGILSQGSPAALLSWSGGDNATITQTGFVQRVNVGDQDMWDRITFTGPGMLEVSNGPGSTDMVAFGPLEAGQVVQIRTDPRKRGVVDLTSTPPTPQQLTFWQQALNDFLSFAAINNSPLGEEIESIFGIRPPQGNLYSLLQGRWSNPIPARSPGDPVQAYSVKVRITNGNADSRAVFTGTPLRRLPY